MRKISTPTVSYATRKVSLNGETYNLTFRYNERTKRWKLDVATEDLTTIVLNLTLMEDQILNYHLTLPELGDGLFILNTARETSAPCGRDNLGINEDYELLFSTVAELS